MKPTKNQVFCPSAQRAKMLFSERSKALNFIKFNYDEILEESGKAPDRAYYCSACGGWHVTSKKLPFSNRRKMKEMLTIAVQHLKDNKLTHCMRFLIYANYYKERITRNNDGVEDASNQIGDMMNKVNKKLDWSLNHPNPPQINKPDFEPFLIHQHDGNYVYAINRCKLLEEDMDSLQLQDGDEVRNLFLHKLNIVDITKDADPSIFKKNYYQSVEDLFEGDLFGYWIQGRRLFVLVGSPKKANSKYLTPQHHTYWIKMGERTVRFFAGTKTRFACLFTKRQMERNDLISYFTKKECA